MPLGFQRLNERTQRPNANINFIKADPNTSEADQKIALDLLSRIAAQCYPVMKEHYISVMALEEYPPNPEFLGRNLNAGECIQLVLKDKGGRWLSFKFVQMVMMHELAHCKQMNHSRFFWNVRNEYAKMMEGLWAKKYTGEGMWGRGMQLASGEYTESMPENVQIPEHLCGGTYRRSRGRKRKRGQNESGERPKETYAERQQKKIARKFGKHGEGNALGEDDLVRGALDRASGKRSTGKPRVAKSKRGRELRANAALARLDALKAQQAAAPETTPELEDDDGSETESGWSSDEDVDASEFIILRRKGGQIKDSKGNDLVKVCGDEGEDEDGGQDEMDELRVLSGRPKGFQEKAPARKRKPGTKPEANDGPWPKEADAGSETEGEPELLGGNRAAPSSRPIGSSFTTKSLPVPSESGRSSSPPQPAAPEPPPPAPGAAPQTSNVSALACPVCSLENEQAAVTCMACSHVLKPGLMKNNWRCNSEACQSSQYVNPGDFGRCGLCGAQKPATVSADSSGGGRGVGDGRPVGLIENEVLRWD